MRIRFQADEDLDGRIIRGLKRKSRDIDIRTAATAGFAGLKDPEILRLSAESGRVLVSQDRRTMPGHFAEYVATTNSSGVILLREAISIAVAIEELRPYACRREGSAPRRSCLSGRSESGGLPTKRCGPAEHSADIETFPMLSKPLSAITRL